MPRSFEPYQKKHFSSSFYQLYQPLGVLLNLFSGYPESPSEYSKGLLAFSISWEKVIFEAL